MNTSTIEKIPVEALGSTLDEGAVGLKDQIIPDIPKPCDQRTQKCEIVSDAGPLERLIKKKQYWGFLEGRDAAFYLSLLCAETTGKRGGRLKKYRTAKAQRRGHADRQRRYRERKVVAIADVTKTPLQPAET